MESGFPREITILIEDEEFTSFITDVLTEIAKCPAGEECTINHSIVFTDGPSGVQMTMITGALEQVKSGV